MKNYPFFKFLTHNIFNFLTFNRMKKIFTFLFFVAVSISAIQAQAVGDYGSVANGNWDAIATWKQWDGSAFATTPAAAPTAGTENVFIQPGFTVTVPSSVTLSFTKTLTLNGGTLHSVSSTGFRTSGATAKIIVATATPTGTSGLTGFTTGLAGSITNVEINASCKAGLELPSANSGTVHLTVGVGVTYNLTSNKQINNLNLNGTLTDDGTARVLTVKGNISGTGTHTGTTGNVIKSTHSGTSTTISGVTLKNWDIATTSTSATSITLLGNVSVTEKLIQSSATASTGAHKIVLGTNDLIVGSITTNTTDIAKNYVVTNNTGRLYIANVGTTAVIFPIGTASECLPITSFSNSGTVDNFGAKIVASAPSCVTAGFTLSVTWDVSETIAGGSDAAMTVQYNSATTKGASFVNTTAKLFHCNGATPDKWGAAGASGAGPFTISASGFTSFSPFGVSSDAVLPIELSSFTATKNNNATAIVWATETESNNDFFNIERSSDGTNFRSIGKKEGAGNSASRINYDFTDENPAQGINYYRLKQTDFDGRFSYSKVVTVNHGAKNVVLISPKSTQSELNIATELDDYTLSIFNTAGQEVKRMSNLSANQTVEIGELNDGIYFVKIQGNGVNETQKVTKF